MKLCVGDVVYSFRKEITPNKNKFCICMNPDEYWFLMINSKDNLKAYDNIPIKLEMNPFLDHDSFISCNPILFFTQDEIDLCNDIVGRISDTDLGELYTHLMQSRYLSRIEKQTIAIKISDWKSSQNN